MQLYTATCSYDFTWTDPDGNIVTPKIRTVSCPYSINLAGEIPVLAGTAEGVEVDIPFTGLTKAASLICVENMTGQELGMAWGGNFMPNLPAGGMMLHAFPSCPAAGPILSLRFFLTGVQAQDGKISYAVLGM
jgi:hypothetical protein